MHAHLQEDDAVTEVEHVFINPPEGPGDPAPGPPNPSRPPWWIPLAVGGGVAVLVGLGLPAVVGLAGFTAGTALPSIIKGIALAVLY